MKLRFEMTNPDDMEATMTITMSVKDWKALRTQLKESWPSWDLSRNIGDIVRQAERAFYPKQDEQA